MQIWLKPWLEEIDSLIHCMLSFVRVVITAVLSNGQAATGIGRYDEEQESTDLLQQPDKAELRHLLRTPAKTRAPGNIPTAPYDY